MLAAQQARPRRLIARPVVGTRGAPSSAHPCYCAFHPGLTLASLHCVSLLGVATNNFAVDELIEVSAPPAKAKAKAKAE